MTIIEAQATARLLGFTTFLVSFQPSHDQQVRIQWEAYREHDTRVWKGAIDALPGKVEHYLPVLLAQAVDAMQAEHLQRVTGGLS